MIRCLIVMFLSLVSLCIISVGVTGRLSTECHLNKLTYSRDAWCGRDSVGECSFPANRKRNMGTVCNLKGGTTVM